MRVLKRFHNNPSDPKSTVGRSPIWSPPKFSLRQYGFVAAGLLLLAGGIVLFAASPSPYASLNADKGTVANGATSKACTGASDGNCVVFGTTPATNDQPAPPKLFDSTDGSIPYLTSEIPQNPVLDPNSTALVATIGSRLPELNVGPQWLVPIYNTSNSDPVYNPSFSEPWGCSVGGSMHIPNFATRESPDASTGGDAWLETVNLDTDIVSAIWQASKSSGTWNASCGGSYPLHGNGFVTGEAHASEVVGVGAGGGEQIGAGMILDSELESGSIDHAFYMTSTETCSTHRTPANTSDGHGSGSTCWPMGSRVQLNPGVNCNGLSNASAAEIMVCKALEVYGGYVLDSGGAGPLSGITTIGDDMTDPNRSPWQTPGDPSRGSANCTPISASCGVLAHFGVTNSNSLTQIPWAQLRVLKNWNGS